MEQPRLCLYTQTPLVRFESTVRLDDGRRALDEWEEDVEYRRSPGGVTRMMEPMLKRLVGTRRVESATWMSLACHGPERVQLVPGIDLEHVRMPLPEAATYAAAKQAYWNAIHGLTLAGDLDIRAVDRGLDRLSHWLGLKTFRRPEAPFDISYVHDFQLLPLARYLPRGLPRVFRWHVPVPASPAALEYAVRCLSDYDAVVVSTERYKRAFQAAGLEVPVHAMYPYLDERRPSVVTAPEIASFERAHGIHRRDVVFLLVARLDPMKGHDVAVRALAKVVRSMDNAKLVCVGGGGFSAGRGGLGMTHAVSWREHVTDVAREAGVEDRVVFTGGIPDHELDVAYTRADVVLLPSVVEGFGLVAVEGWEFGKPVVVSEGAGVSELVEPGRNGYTFPPGDADALAECLLRAAGSREHATRLGQAGRRTAEVCNLKPAVDRVWRVLASTMEGRRVRRPI